MKKRLEEFLPEVSDQALKAPLSVDMEHKKLEPEDVALLKEIQDGMRDRKDISGSATQ